MKKFMNRMAKKEGFTLVELIVVIAILAILAGVAVPAYSAYINNANESADEQVLEAVNTAIASALAIKGKDMTDADEYLTVTYSNGTVTVAAKDLATDAEDAVAASILAEFDEFYGGTTFTLKHFTSVVLGDTGVVEGSGS